MKRCFAIVLVVITFLSCIALFDSVRFADPDLFCHLYSGKEIVEERSVPSTDTHSFSVYGEKWIDYEWGMRALFFLMYDWLGPSGLVLFRIAIAILLLTVLFLSAMRLSGSAVISSFALILGAAAFSRYFLFRTQLITFFFLALLVLLLIEIKRGKRAFLFVVPFVFLVWANLHGGFPLGLVIVALFIFSEILPRKEREHANENYRCEVLRHRVKQIMIPLCIFLVSLFITLLNPYGVDLWKGILGTIFGSFTPELSEWKPAYAFPFSLLIWFYIFLIMFAITFIAAKKRISFDLLLFMLLGYLSITKVRFVPLFAIILTPYLAHNLKLIGDRIEQTGKVLMKTGSYALMSLRGVLVAVVLLPLIVKGAQGQLHPHLKIFKTDFYQPVSAVKIMKENGMAGNVMNEYDWGGYIHWEIPQIKIFVDGRSDTVYPKSTTDEWTLFINGREGWSKVPDRYGADVILIRTQQEVNKALQGSGRWKIIYFDNISSLYVDMESSRNALFLKKWLDGHLVIEGISAEDYILE